MSAKRNLKGYFRKYGYDDLTGLTTIAKQCLIKNIDFYTELHGERPAVFFREKESEWLVCMKMEDFMELYRSWEIDTAEVRDLPFYGSGERKE